MKSKIWIIVIGVTLIVFIISEFIYSPEPMTEPLSHTEKQKDSIYAIKLQENQDSVAISVANQVEMRLPTVVKKRLHDPSSFEKHSIKSWNKGNHILTKMNYSAKNELGVRIRKTIEIKTPLEKRNWEWKWEIVGEY